MSSPLTGRSVLRAGVLALTCSLAACGSNEKREREPIGSFRLTTELYGDARLLGLVAGNEALPAVSLVDADESVRQADSAFWEFTVFGQGIYRIDNAALGEGVSLGVSYRTRPGFAELVATSRISSQLWFLTPLANGYCRLSTVLFGEEQALGVIDDADGRVIRLMPKDDVGAQHWKLVASETSTEEAVGSPCSGEAFAG